MAARLPMGNPLPRSINEGAALPEVDCDGPGAVVVGALPELSPTRALRLSSSVKLTLTEVPLVQELGTSSAAPETKLTAAHCN